MFYGAHSLSTLRLFMGGVCCYHYTMELIRCLRLQEERDKEMVDKVRAQEQVMHQDKLISDLLAKLQKYEKKYGKLKDT